MKKYFSLAVMLCALPVLSYSQENGIASRDTTGQKEYKHNIGASIGYIAGPGISYRYWINNTYGVQASLYPYYYKHDQEKDVNLSVGVMGLRTLSSTRRLDLFAYLGTRFQHKYYTNGNIGGNEYETEDDILHLGGGPGIEVKLGRVSLNAMVGIRGRTNFKEEQQVGLSAEGAVYYRF